MVLTTTASTPGQLWVDKYKPQFIAQMCYPVSANKLKAWIENFEPAGTGDAKKTRGALLSGPPGVGKTTSVYVVAKELGRTVVEYNASDFRSRKSLREHVTDVVNNRTFSSGGSSYADIILLMDEVDGCDIGGVGEVIQMIKSTNIPIVCTCNDRWNQKLRTLLNYVEDIRVSRPPCNIVANYLCDKVLAREGVSLSKQLLQDIIQRSGSDIRNMLNNLQVWCINRTTLEQRRLAECAVESAKNGDVGLFEAAEMFLLQGTSRGKHETIEALQSAFYNSDLVDLFVQENYLHFNPENRDWMDAVADAADSISFADGVQRIMYFGQNWSVSRTYMQLSSIAPCAMTRGHYESFLSGQQVFFDRQRPVKFPSWLGHNSTTNKNKRLLRCLGLQATNHVKGISGNQEDVLLDYIPLGWEGPLTMPLAEHGKVGIEKVMQFMDQYHIMRDDWEFIQSMSHFKKMQSASRSYPSMEIPSLVKSAFTREFNKSHRTESFAKGTLKHTGAETQEDEENTEENGDVIVGGRKNAKKPAAKAAAKTAAKSSVKKGANEKPKAKRPAPKAKSSRKRTRRESDSEDEISVSSND